MPGPEQRTPPPEGRDAWENQTRPETLPLDLEEDWDGEGQEESDWKGYSQTILKHFL
jgi:hypothetical protein